MNANERYAEIEARLKAAAKWEQIPIRSLVLEHPDSGPTHASPEEIALMASARDDIAWLLSRCRAGDRLLAALDRCEGTRGAFSCVEPHDGRCPIARCPEKQWLGAPERPWACECGREELDAERAALEAEKETP